MRVQADQSDGPAASPAGLLPVLSGHQAPYSACGHTPCPSAVDSLTAAMSPSGGQKGGKQTIKQIHPRKTVCVGGWVSRHLFAECVLLFGQCCVSQTECLKSPR